jgi:predicted nucleotidyltransferase
LPESASLRGFGAKPLPEYEFGEILRVLKQHDVRFIVIGAIAAIAQGYPLNTQDIDITPARDPANLERLANALAELGARLRTPAEDEGVPFPVDAQMLDGADMWTLRTKYGDLDLSYVPSGTQGYEDLRRDAHTEKIDGVEVAIASLADIIRSKEAAGRVKDQAQLPALRRTLELVRRRESQS